MLTGLSRKLTLFFGVVFFLLSELDDPDLSLFVVSDEDDAVFILAPELVESVLNISADLALFVLSDDDDAVSILTSELVEDVLRESPDLASFSFDDLELDIVIDVFDPFLESFREVDDPVFPVSFKEEVDVFFALWLLPGLWLFAGLFGSFQDFWDFGSFQDFGFLAHFGQCFS